MLPIQSRLFEKRITGIYSCVYCGTDTLHYLELVNPITITRCNECGTVWYQQADTMEAKRARYGLKN